MKTEKAEPLTLITESGMNVKEVLELSCSVVENFATIHAIPAIHGSIMPAVIRVNKSTGAAVIVEPEQRCGTDSC